HALTRHGPNVIGTATPYAREIDTGLSVGNRPVLAITMQNRAVANCPDVIRGAHPDAKQIRALRRRLLPAPATRTSGLRGRGTAVRINPARRLWTHRTFRHANLRVVATLPTIGARTGMIVEWHFGRAARECETN